MSNAPATAAPLDDVMLAMDVVDTLRHRQDLVTRELDGASREKQLIEKLRELYHQQGIEVPDHILKEGVEALAQSRFVYDPPKPGFGTTLARLYVGRKRWGPAIAAARRARRVRARWLLRRLQPAGRTARPKRRGSSCRRRCPAQMDALYQTIFEETKVQQAVDRCRGDRDARQGRGRRRQPRRGARRRSPTDGDPRHAAPGIPARRRQPRKASKSAFWRFPETNTDAPNYYLVVEALDADGKPLSLPILNEENGDDRDGEHLGHPRAGGGLSRGRGRQEGRRHHPAQRALG